MTKHNTINSKKYIQNKVHQLKVLFKDYKIDFYTNKTADEYIITADPEIYSNPLFIQHKNSIQLQFFDLYPACYLIFTTNDIIDSL